MKALVGAFNQEKALVGAFSVIVQSVVEPMDRFAALLRNPRIMGIDFTFLRNIGKWCVNLEGLTIALYSEVFLTSAQRIPDRDVFFPKLKSLMFEGDISIYLIETVLFAVKRLERLSIYVHGFNFSAGALDSLLLNLVKTGNLAQLRYLQVGFFNFYISVVMNT